MKVPLWCERVIEHHSINMSLCSINIVASAYLQILKRTPGLVISLFIIKGAFKLTLCKCSHVDDYLINKKLSVLNKKK